MAIDNLVIAVGSNIELHSPKWTYEGYPALIYAIFGGFGLGCDFGKELHSPWLEFTMA